MLYHFHFIGDKLIIGKFCAIIKDVKFIMNDANHKVSGFSTYPFPFPKSMAWIDTDPRTLHHLDHGNFMVAGERIKLKSKMK